MYADLSLVVPLHIPYTWAAALSTLLSKCYKWGAQKETKGTPAHRCE